MILSCGRSPTDRKGSSPSPSAELSKPAISWALRGRSGPHLHPLPTRPTGTCPERSPNWSSLWECLMHSQNHSPQWSRCTCRYSFRTWSTFYSSGEFFCRTVVEGCRPQLPSPALHFPGPRFLYQSGLKCKGGSYLFYAYLGVKIIKISTMQNS